jgi:prolipoprotein diacylglyceryl transferase
MYPDLSYFFHDLLGTNVDNWTSIFKTFGLFLALTFLVSAFILSKEINRMELLGLVGKLKSQNTTNKAANPQNAMLKDLILNSLIAGFIAYKLPYIMDNFTAFKQNPAGLLFASGGNILIGILAAAAVAGLVYYSYKGDDSKQALVKEWPHQKVGDIIIIAAVTGIIGSRIFSLLENWQTFIADPIGQLFSGSGLTIYGGIIFAGLTLVWYSKRIGLPTQHLADAAAPCLALGYGIGRMGCQFSGDGDWGINNPNPSPDWWFLPDWAWSYSYPRNVLREGVPIEDCVGIYCNELSPMVYPTPVYEICIAIVTFAILWSLRTRMPRGGMLFFIYLFMTGLARFFVEGIRVNDRYDLLGLGWSLSQWIAVLFMLGGIAGYFIMRKNGKLLRNTQIGTS